MKEAIFQSNFVGGELSPHLHDRTDLTVYTTSCARLRNFIPMLHGPLSRRQGSQYVVTAGSNVAVRLVPFSFSAGQSFVLEFTPGKLRVLYKDGIILNAAGNAPFEAIGPWREEDLPNLCWAQYRDWLYVTDGVHKPYVVKRYANNNWNVEELVFDDQPAEWGAGNWPRFICFYEQRAVYAATPSQPQQLWFSMTALPEKFTRKTVDEIKDDNAFTYTIFSTDANGITWLQAAKNLLIGTYGGEYRVGSNVIGDALTPKNIKIQPQTFYGSARKTTVKANAAVLFITRSSMRIRALEYSVMEEQFTATDLTMYASHALLGRAKEITIQTAPDVYFWVVTEAGELAGCTYEKAQKVLAWHLHTTDGQYISACALPTEADDVIYVAVRRGANIIIERFYDMMSNLPYDPKQAWFVDSGLRYDGAPASSLTGLQHLEGKTVSILADGWVAPDQVVVNGSITLPSAASNVQVGLPYKSEFVSLIPQSTQKMTVGLPRRITDITVALENSYDFWYRDTSLPDAQFAYSGPTGVMNKAQEPFSGHKTFQVNSQSTKTAQIEIYQDRPLPFLMRGLLCHITPSTV